MPRLLVVLVLSVLGLAACGDDETTSTETSQARVYFLLDEKVWPVARDLPDGDDAASDIVSELNAGPNEGEREIGLAGTFPEDVDVEVANGVATVTFDGELTREQLARLVYSLTELDEVQSVEVGGQSYARDDFEEETPSVLVLSPLAYEQVTTPLTASGTANTFEANFQYELLDAQGSVIDKNFVTATSGTGTRGTFEFTTAKVDDVATLVVFESSAEDGSRMREVEIPLVDAS